MRTEAIEDNDIYEILTERGISVGILDHKVWNVIEDIDALLEPHGLEVVWYEDNLNLGSCFSIQPIERVMNDS